MPSHLPRTIDRRAVLGTLGTVSVTGCQQLIPSRDKPRFSSGPASWTPGTDEIPAGEWPMVRADAQGSGAVPWSTGPTPPLDRHWVFDADDGWYRRPVVANGQVFAAVGQRLQALDAETGEPNWQYNASKRITGAPAVANGTVYLNEGVSQRELPATVRAIDATTGALQWEYEHDLTFGGWVLATNGTVYVPARDRLLALDAGTGHLVWWYEVGYPYSGVTSVAVGPELVYATANTGNRGDADTTRPITGTLVALDPIAGEVRWSVEQDYPGYVAVAGDRVLVQSERRLTAFDAATGEWVWVELLRTEARTAPLAILDDVVYYQAEPDDEESGAVVAAVSLADGSERARYDLGIPEPDRSTPFLSGAGEQLYVLTSGEESRLDVIDLAAGAIATPGEPAVRLPVDRPSALTVADGAVFVAEFGWLAALQ